MHALMYARTCHGCDREYYNRGSLQPVYLEVLYIGSARQFLADEGIQSKEGTEAVEMQQVCVLLPLLRTNYMAPR